MFPDDFYQVISGNTSAFFNLVFKRILISFVVKCFDSTNRHENCLFEDLICHLLIYSY